MGGGGGTTGQGPGPWRGLPCPHWDHRDDCAQELGHAGDTVTVGVLLVTEKGGDKHPGLPLLSALQHPTCASLWTKWPGRSQRAKESRCVFSSHTEQSRSKELF